MLRSVKSLKGYKIGATDGELGKVDTFLFHDFSWIVRYLVADTGNWLPGRRVLISPASIEQPVADVRMLPVNLTKDQVENSPDLGVDEPISRQAEQELHEYYDWTPYWIGTGINAPAMEPSAVEPTKEEKEEAAVAAKQKADLTLRSTQEVVGYRIHATDGDMGHAEDLILDDETWNIRYLVVDTRNWLPGRSVLISTEWIEKIDWAESKVWIDLPKEQIKDSPSYDPSAPVNQEYETRLYDFYGRPKYWV